MAYWLVKSEPSAYSWDQLVADKQTAWTGVRNYAARGHLKGNDVMLKDENGGMAKITIKDVNQKNGVIHVIDSVLLPK